VAYIFREALLRIISLGISANGVLDEFGGVLRKGGGGNPGNAESAFGGGNPGRAGNAFDGVGDLITGPPPRIPAARNLSRRALGSCAEFAAGGG